MGRGILRGAGGDENLKSNFIWPIQHIVVLINIFLAGGKPVSGKEKIHKKYLLEILLNRTFFLLV